MYTLAWKNLRDPELMEVVHTQTRRETIPIAGGGRTLKGEMERENGQNAKRKRNFWKPVQGQLPLSLETQDEPQRHA